MPVPLELSGIYDGGVSALQWFPALLCLKAYYEIVDEARPLSRFFPTHADFFYGNAFPIMKLSKPPSFTVIQALT